MTRCVQCVEEILEGYVCVYCTLSLWQNQLHMSVTIWIKYHSNNYKRSASNEIWLFVTCLNHRVSGIISQQTTTRWPVRFIARNSTFLCSSSWHGRPKTFYPLHDMAAAPPGAAHGRHHRHHPLLDPSEVRPRAAPRLREDQSSSSSSSRRRRRRRVA